MHRLPLGHRAHRPAPHPLEERRKRRACAPTPGQTVGPFFGYALPYDARQRAGAARHARTRSGCTAGCSTAPASRCRTRCSRSGRPTPTAGRAASRARCTATATRSPAGAGPRPTAQGRYAFSTLRARRRPPFFAVTVFARGLLDRLFTRAYLPRARPTTRSSPRSTPTVARRWSPTPDETGFVFDIRLQGERRDRLPRLPARLSDMTDLFWPGDDRAGDHFTDGVLPRGDGRGRGGLARPGAGVARRALTSRSGRATTRWLARADGGNPVIPLVELLRAGSGRAPARVAAPGADQPGRRSTPR